MKLLLLTASVLISSIFAQDTYHCPDGWLLEEDRSGCRCFLLSGSEMVTKDDADILCAYHDGAWVAELDHPGINYWLKSQLLDLTEIGEREQFWLGAYTNERHSENHPGEWIWPHMNKTVEWFDWADGQPNNLQGQDCVVMREYHNPLFPIARDYFWNDFDCDYSAHYICENKCRQ